jgi:hypothetical protein
MLVCTLYFTGFGAILAAIWLQITPETADGFLSNVYPTTERVAATFSNIVPFPIFESFHEIGFIIAVPLIGWLFFLPREKLMQRGEAPAPLVALLLIWVYATSYMIFATRCVYARTPLPILAGDRFLPYNRADLTALEHIAAKETARLAPVAHVASHDEATIDRELAREERVVLARYGVTLAVVPVIKTSTRQVQNEQAGIDGESSIATSETVVSADVLWQDRPFIVAHEWGHISGFGRESDANSIAALTCATSPNPVIAYSGWLQILRDSLAYFDPDNPGDRLALLVRQDLRRSTALTAAVIVAKSNAKWTKSYEKQLRYEHVPGGVESYEGYLPDIVGHPSMERFLLIGQPIPNIRQRVLGPRATSRS